MGTKIGFAPGYNDVDPGEHLPGSYDQLRWINRSSPWGEASQDGKAPLGWGAIEMGPMLTVSE